MQLEDKKLAVQAHLAEYAALRAELLEILKWRDRLAFLSLSISGALISFSLSSSGGGNAGIPSRRVALYLVAPLASAIGGLWFVNAWRIRRIGVYIQNVIAARINHLLRIDSEPTASAVSEVLAWGNSNEIIQYKWPRRLVEWFVLVISFVATGGCRAMADYGRSQGLVLERDLAC
jgi:hypothetical protein